MIHTNPFDGPDRVFFPAATIRFDSEILGFYFETASLLETDEILGLPGTLYEKEFENRGARSFPASESISIRNGNELVVTLNANAARGAMDNVRVITRGHEVGVNFLRGDCNGDGDVNLSDAACGLTWLFAGAAEPGCVAALNTNGDADIDIADPVSLLNFLFGGGPAPAAPFPECGPGVLPADPVLGCANPPACQ